MRRFRLRLPVKWFRAQAIAATCCDLAPGGCPASCPDAHRPTHGHRHVRNWAIAQISDMDAHYKKFFENARAQSIADADRRGATCVVTVRRRQPRVAKGSTRCALRRNAIITRDAADEEQALRDVLAVESQIQIAGDRPAAGKRGAEHLGADQDRRADHGQHVLPQNPGGCCGSVCRSWRGSLLAGAISAKAMAESSRSRGHRPRGPGAGTAGYAGRNSANGSSTVRLR